MGRAPLDTETSNADWYGEGASFQLDSSKKFTVVTQFHAGAGGLTNISRFYLQEGNRIHLPTIYVIKPTDGSHYGAFKNPSITKDYCGEIYDRWSEGGDPLTQMGANMEKGMVLAMSAWYSAETYENGMPAGGASQTGMSWLDGNNKWGKTGPCDVSTTDSGTHYATFSDIRVGEIGTTTKDKA